LGAPDSRVETTDIATGNVQELSKQDENGGTIYAEYIKIIKKSKFNGDQNSKDLRLTQLSLLNDFFVPAKQEITDENSDIL
jgi:hypothetical protein